MMQVDSLRVNAPAGMKRGRAVTMTHSTQTVAYTAAAAAGDYISISEEENGVISIKKLSTFTGKLFAEAGGTVTVGSDLEVVGTEGKFVNKSAGVAVVKAGISGASGSFISIYN